jgi:hypothetical protein
VFPCKWLRADRMDAGASMRNDHAPPSDEDQARRGHWNGRPQITCEASVAGVLLLGA